MKIALIGDYASQNYLIGKELERRGLDVSYFLQKSIYLSRPDTFYDLGSVQGPLLRNYIQTGFWMIFGKFLRKYDLQQINGTYPNCVRAKHTSYHYHGSDLRLGTVTPKYPSFVSQKELLDYSNGSVFLPRCVDTELFFENRAIKEAKETFRSENEYTYIIGHFSRHPEIKGTGVVEKACLDLCEETDYSIHLIKQNFRREVLPRVLNYCDMIIDHVNPEVGQTYNVLSLEALMCNVQVCCYYSDEHIEFLDMKKNIHKMTNDVEQVKQTIINCIESEKNIDQDIVLKHHSPRAVVDFMLSIWHTWRFI